jgi:hypothetical protein
LGGYVGWGGTGALELGAAGAELRWWWGGHVRVVYFEGVEEY